VRKTKTIDELIAASSLGTPEAVAIRKRANPGAVARALVPRGTPTELTCPSCASSMVLKDSRYGKFYSCITFPKCRTTHGAHPDGQPLGKPATPETRQWRVRAHDAFDALWKGSNTRMSRGQAYVHMQTLMGMTADEAHIGNFDEDQCVDLIERLAIEEFGGG